MSMRELVTGAAACAVPDGGASSSNPMGAFANTLLGFSQKKQEGLRELPVARPSYPDSSFDLKPADPLAELIGPQQHHPPDTRSSEFLQSFRSADHGMLTGAWEEANRPVFRPHPPLPPPNMVAIQNQPSFSEMDQIFNDNIQRQPSMDGPPQRIMSNFLWSFVNSSRSGLPFQPVPLPNLMLSPEDKLRIRNRSCIMARHIFADKSEDYINSQVNALLHSLDIDSDIQLNGLHPRYPELENLWNESQGAPYHQGPHSADKWVTEFNRFVPHGNSESWASSFQREHGADNWASEFDREQKQVVSAGLMGSANGSSIAAMEHSRMLAHTLSQNSDPKFQNSKFLQFVSKMSQGELIVDDNQIKQVSTAREWADEYHHQRLDGDSGSWANQFSNQHDSGGGTWAKEFASERVHRGPVDEQWVNEFSNLHLQDWGEEFSDQIKNGILGDDTIDAWANAYDDFVDEQQRNFHQGSRSVYVFSDLNPYVGHPDPLTEGQELFRKGLLSEAVLALEAEVMKNPDNAEGWRLLGVTHAENDDDQQAIAAMLRSHEADPRNLEVLLALGVSHTNEMESREALKYLFQWIQHHPKYGQLIPQERANVIPIHADVTRLYYEAAEMSPQDVDVHVVLGVLYNLSREFDKAIPAFDTALRLKPRDYSLWNKLGATAANSGKSEDAISAYQEALDLKPNYVRAWANMGISFANKGMYEDSIRYYVRALAMNPKADSTWRYLQTSLGFASRGDMIEACKSRNLDLLQKEFPL